MMIAVSNNKDVLGEGAVEEAFKELDHDEVVMVSANTTSLFEKSQVKNEDNDDE